MNLYLITFTPPLIILLYIIYSDKFKEPTSMIIKTFLIGVLLIFPAGFLNQLLIFSHENPSSMTFIAGFTEEILKFMALYFFIRKKFDFNEPMDGIVYGTLISLGFASLENYEYVFYSNYDPMNVALIRSVTAIPLHACCGITMGFYFGLHFFTDKKSYLLKSLLIPIGLHASYNFLLSVNLLGIAFLIFIILNTKRLHNKLKEMQKTKKVEDEVKLR